MNKIKDLKVAEVEALSAFSDQIGDLLNSMDDFRYYLDKKDERRFDKTYKNLVYFWEKLEDELIMVLGADEREGMK